MPHLFLQESDTQYREWILPRGVPTGKNYQKKLVRTGNQVERDKVDYHTEGSGEKGREKQYRGTKKHASSTAEASGKGRADGKGTLMAKKKSELYDMAAKCDIHGRSKMDKAGLAEAILKH